MAPKTKSWVSLLALSLGLLPACGPQATDEDLGTVESAAEGCSGYVALTFDDGPGGNTNTLLGILKTAGVQATLFNIGQNAASNAALVKAEVAAGMWVSNHSYTHGHMTSMSQSQMQDELSKTNQTLTQNGASPKVFRPPYGETNATLQSAASAAGLKLVTWDVDSQDWNGASTDAIVSAAGKLTNGQVLLMHDTYQTTNAAIPKIVANLKAKGLCAGMIDPSSGRAVAPTGSTGGGTTPGTGGVGGSSGRGGAANAGGGGPGGVAGGLGRGGATSVGGSSGTGGSVSVSAGGSANQGRGGGPSMGSGGQVNAAGNSIQAGGRTNAGGSGGGSAGAKQSGGSSGTPGSGGSTSATGAAGAAGKVSGSAGTSSSNGGGQAGGAGTTGGAAGKASGAAGRGGASGSDTKDSRATGGASNARGGSAVGSSTAGRGTVDEDDSTQVSSATTDSDGTSPSSQGCGCRVAGVRSASIPFWGVGLLALGRLRIARRRRLQSARSCV